MPRHPALVEVAEVVPTRRRRASCCLAAPVLRSELGSNRPATVVRPVPAAAVVLAVGSRAGWGCRSGLVVARIFRLIS